MSKRLLSIRQRRDSLPNGKHKISSCLLGQCCNILPRKQMIRFDAQFALAFIQNLACLHTRAFIYTHVNKHALIQVCTHRHSHTHTGTTFSPEGMVLGPGGVVLRQPADTPCLMHAAQCAALCNDSQVFVAQKTGTSVRFAEMANV